MMRRVRSRTDKRRRRNGSAILVCTLAAAVLSLAAIAILRSSRHQIARTGAQRSSVQGHQVSDGLVQRCVAILRANPSAVGRVTDSGAAMPDAFAELIQLSPTATQIRIYMYAGATTPAFDRIVDPNTL